MCAVDKTREGGRVCGGEGNEGRVGSGRQVVSNPPPPHLLGHDLERYVLRCQPTFRKYNLSSTSPPWIRTRRFTRQRTSTTIASLDSGLTRTRTQLRCATVRSKDRTLHPQRSSLTHPTQDGCAWGYPRLTQNKVEEVGAPTAQGGTQNQDVVLGIGCAVAAITAIAGVLTGYTVDGIAIAGVLTAVSGVLKAFIKS